MHRLVYCLLYVVIATSAVAAQTATDLRHTFDMQHPPKWTTVTKGELNENIEKFDLSEKSLDRLLNENKKDTLVVAYYKYDPKTTPGIIPTIQIRIRPNGTGSFAVFKQAIANSIKDFRRTFPDIVVQDDAREVMISGIKSVVMTFSYSLKSGGETYKIRSRTYAVPRGKYFFQINFTDEPEGEDCSKEFDSLIGTVKIG